MTGLLHRLATRATGTAWTVRSDVRLPYGAEGFDRSQGSTAALSLEAAVPETRPTEHASRVIAAQKQAVPPHAQSLAAAARPEGPAQAAARDSPRGSARQAVATRLPQATTAAAQTPDARADTAAAIAPLASLRTPESPLSPPLSRSEGPAPLLPPRPSTSGHAAPATVRGAAGLTTRPATHGGGGHETEVHIHIGRIDVTALQEAPRPKTRPRERTQPVSLDAYLARRKS